MNNPPDRLTVELLSDTTFGRGEGTAGAVDVEVDHDAFGLPFVHGTVLRGLLRDAWLSMRRQFPELAEAARQVLGTDGDLADSAILRVGVGRLPEEVRAWVRYAVERAEEPLRPEQVLQTLTAVRRQTAQSRLTGAAEETSPRSSRVVLRGLTFEAPLTWLAAPGPQHLQCLALCALAVRHAGLGRNRGRGFVRLALDGDEAGTRQAAGLGGGKQR
jgi:hypothetical protein